MYETGALPAILENVHFYHLREKRSLERQSKRAHWVERSQDGFQGLRFVNTVMNFRLP